MTFITARINLDPLDLGVNLPTLAAFRGFIIPRTYQFVTVGLLMVCAGGIAVSMPLWPHGRATPSAEPLLSLFMVVLYAGAFIAALPVAAGPSCWHPRDLRFRLVCSVGSLGITTLSAATLYSWITS